MEKIGISTIRKIKKIEPVAEVERRELGETVWLNKFKGINAS